MESFDQQFKHYTKEIANRVSSFSRDNQLELFLPNTHINLIHLKLNLLIEQCRVLQLVPQLDEQTLASLFTLTERSLDTLFGDWTKLLIDAKNDIDPLTLIDCVITPDEKDCACLTSSIIIQDTSTVLYATRLSRTQDLSSMRTLIARNELLCTETRQAIATFIEDTDLREYYADQPNILVDREQDIIQWLRTCFTETGLVIAFDLCEPYLLRQLMTCDKLGIKSLLSQLLRHRWFHTKNDAAPFEKREVTLACRQFRRDDPLLIEQMRYNEATFSNPDEYAEIRVQRDKTTEVIDVAVVKFNEQIKVMVFLEDSAYANIQGSLIAARLFKHRLLEKVDNHVTLKSVSHQVAEQRLLDIKIRGLLDAYLEASVIPKNCAISIETIDCLARRILSLVNLYTGLIGAWHTVKETLDSLMRDLDTVIIKRKGHDSFKGSLELTTEMIPIQKFDDAKNDEVVRLLPLVPQASRSEVENHQKQRTNICLLSIKDRKHSLASIIMPCLPDDTYYDSRDSSLQLLAFVTPVKTRKRKAVAQDENLEEKYKRVRRIKEVRKGDENLEIFRYSRSAVELSQFSAPQTCIVCEKLKQLRSFSKTDKRTLLQDTHVKYTYVYNICSSCMKNSDITKKKLYNTL